MHIVDRVMWLLIILHLLSLNGGLGDTYTQQKSILATCPYSAPNHKLELCTYGPDLADQPGRFSFHPSRAAQQYQSSPKPGGSFGRPIQRHRRGEMVEIPCSSAHRGPFGGHRHQLTCGGRRDGLRRRLGRKTYWDMS